MVDTLFASTIDPLPREEERELVIRWQQEQDEAALERLVRANTRFVIDHSRRFANPTASLTFEEIISEGIDGLLEAINRFDATQGTKLISYAVWWIEQRIKDALAENRRIIHIPTNQGVDWQKISRSITKLEQELGRSPNEYDVAEDTGLPRWRVVQAMRNTLHDIELNAPVFNYSERGVKVRERVNFFADDRELAPDEWTCNAEVQELIRARLDAREQFIVHAYYGMDGGDPLTLEEIGEHLGVTRERIRQLKDGCLRKLRRKVWVQK